MMHPGGDLHMGAQIARSASDRRNHGERRVMASACSSSSQRPRPQFRSAFPAEGHVREARLRHPFVGRLKTGTDSTFVTPPGTLDYCSPGATTVAVLTTALVVGVNAAAFS